MIDKLHASLDDVLWVLNAYALAAEAAVNTAIPADAGHRHDDVPARTEGGRVRHLGRVAGLATIAGPTLGGLLVTAFDWRWIFFVNLPIGAAVLGLTFFIIPGFQPGRRHRFDILGVTLASLALLAICYGLVEGQRYDWGTVTSFVSIPLIIAAGVVLLVMFLVVQRLRQDREPLVPFTLFRSRNFSLMNGWPARPRGC